MSLGTAWVVGRGLLGGNLERALEGAWDLYRPAAPHPWGDPEALARAFDLEAAECLARARRNGGALFVAWTAGVGVIGSPAEVLASDERALGQLLAALDRAGAIDEAQFFHAGSAGGAWGGSLDRPVTERSPVAPLNDYGRTRLRMEDAVRAWVEGRRGWRALLGRISTLFGPGQDLQKAQGLLSHVSRSVIFDRPVNIYVPLDTLRDFLFAPDCAAAIAESARLLLAQPRDGERCTMKLFADEQSVSLLQVAHAVGKVGKRRVKLTTARTQPLGAQAPALVFRSLVLPEARVRRTDFVTAVSLLHQEQLRVFREGRLRAPA